MDDVFREPVKTQVGRTLANVSPLKRLAMLQRNAIFLKGGKWTPPADDGTLVKKAVGRPFKADGDRTDI